MKSIIAALGITAALATVLIALHGEGNVGPTRPARYAEACPAVDSPDGILCDAGMHQAKGFCVCLTHAIDPLPNEVETDDIAANKKIMMVLCEEGVRYVAYGIIPVDCLLVTDNHGKGIKFPGISTNHIPMGIEDLLFERCYPTAWAAGKPSIISSGSWGLCPHCLKDSSCVYPKDVE